MSFEKGSQYTKPKYYVGLADCRVVLVNPTKEELSSIGINMKEELVYTGMDEKGNRKIRIDFWLQMRNGNYVPLRFFIYERESVAQTGSFEWINNYGLSTFAKSIEEITARNIVWFDIATVRKAYDGEVALIDFIKNWFAVPKEQPAYIETWKAIFSGDVSELKGLIKTANANPENPYLIQVLLYVNGKGYQSVYTRFFARGNSANRDRWTKHFEGLNSNPLHLGADLNFKEIEGILPDSPSSESDTGKEEEKGW